MRAAVVGITGPELTLAEAALFQELPPAGVILFGRNVADPVQLRTLTDALRRVLPAGAHVVVDQEGGRVARLRPPHWREHPSAGRIAALHARDPDGGMRAAWLNGALIGLDCAAAGVDVACAPVLDLVHPGADAVVGDRSFGSDPDTVAALATAMADGLLAAGVLPVGKHAPGHGWATVDSHHALPHIPAGTDLRPDLRAFRLCIGLPWMMTAHLLFADWDPVRPGTLSPPVIGDVIRGRIGFRGVLVSDDLAMKALDGPPERRAMSALAAGCDLALYCPGDLDANRAVLRACCEVGVELRRKLEAGEALRRVRVQPGLDSDALAQERDALAP